MIVSMLMAVGEFPDGELYNASHPFLINLIPYDYQVPILLALSSYA